MRFLVLRSVERVMVAASRAGGDNAAASAADCSPAAAAPTLAPEPEAGAGDADATREAGREEPGVAQCRPRRATASITESTPSEAFPPSASLPDWTDAVPAALAGGGSGDRRVRGREASSAVTSDVERLPAVAASRGRLGCCGGGGGIEPAFASGAAGLGEIPRFSAVFCSRLCFDLS